MTIASTRRTVRRPLGGALFAGVAAVALLAASGMAYADVIFTQGNHPTDETNIYFKTPETGTTIFGQVSQSNPIPVEFSSSASPPQTLYQTAQGQADIESAASTTDSAITALTITVPNYTFGDFIMNPLNGTGTATVTAIDNFNHVFNYDLGTGQNYLTITTANGESISKLMITMSIDGYFQQFKQPRIGELQLTQTPVPEPSSLAVFSAGLIGLAFAFRVRRRRRH